MPCTGGAISPPQNVSFGFNIRLRVAERAGAAVRVSLTEEVLSAGVVPLVWDIDGERAVANDRIPHFSGPSLDSPEAFAGDQYWFPGLRHNGAANFAFIDGHVESSAQPLRQATWDWGYTPQR
jgi:prepilin-type processing-associated H-X9-DG protein